jgi:hypothetical protein
MDTPTVRSRYEPRIRNLMLPHNQDRRLETRPIRVAGIALGYQAEFASSITLSST